ncbi:hypothetical protein HMPREF9999_00522 [Alloprevotella sp. oral taxon 473 str. F0040]|nr:hypothetical protein HMPREF9999_00522 [Alloprevotella sp. oral taxon 473 str. F0040]
MFHCFTFSKSKFTSIPTLSQAVNHHLDWGTSGMAYHYRAYNST